VRSSHPPERLEVELQSVISPSLSQRGYRVVGHGITGITWRREMSGKLIAGIAVLALLCLGGVLSGDPGSILFGVVSGLAAGLLFYFRRPANVTIVLTRIQGGTELNVTGGPDAARAKTIAQRVAGPEPPNSEQSGPEAPGSLWSPPHA